VIIEITPPQQEGDDWQIAYDWQSDNLGQATKPLTPEALKNDKLELTIPFGNTTIPGIDGKLRFVVSAWNV
jgi:hypothetical protein